MTYRKRADKNHTELSDALRKCGFIVVDCSRVGGGFPDVLVGRNGKCCLLEYKTSTGKLNALQKQFLDQFSGCTAVVRTPVEAIAAARRLLDG